MKRGRALRGAVVRRGALLLFWAGLALLPACGGPSGAGEAGPAGAGPLVIGRSGKGAPEDPAVSAWWTSFFAQCQEAVREKDAAHLESLLARVEGRRAPEWAGQTLARFQAILRGMKLVREGKVLARFALPRRDFREGDIVFFGLRLENHGEGPVALPAPGTRGFLQARLRIVDYGVFGERWESKRPLNLPLEKPFDLPAGEKRFEGFRPFQASLPPGAVLRVVRFQGDLLLGSVLAGGEVLPLKSLPIQPTEMRVFPKGYEPIARKPLLTLKRALELGDRKHFPHVVLAAYFMPPAARDEARSLLMEAARRRGKAAELARVVEGALNLLGAGR